MQHQFVITIDSKVSPDFAINFLRNVNFIKSIKRKKKDKKESEAGIDEITLLSEQALSRDWLREEEDMWDEVL